MQADERHQGRSGCALSEFDLRSLIEALHDRDLLGIPVRVCSLARLREMKQAQSRTQDRLDLENLPKPED
ncbi:MAG TPA: hypothetical protein VGH58_09165 [Solirubrobacterales bacterium]